MKILQINKYNYLKGGSETVFFNTESLLQQRGHEVVKFCTINEKNDYSKYESYFVDAPEIRNLRGLSKFKSIPRFFINNDAKNKLEKLILDEKPDVAHLHNIFNGISLGILPVLKYHKIPVVITMHDTRFICPSSYFNLRGKLCEKCHRSFFINCAKNKCYQDTVTNSIMCMLEMIHKEYLFDYNKYISKYIFVSNRFWNFHSIRHLFFKEKGTLLYNFAPKLDKIEATIKRGDYLFFYGRITAEKGIKTLVETMTSFPNLKLKIAGSGPLIEDLKRTSSSNVDFVGFITGTQLEDYIKGSSFVIVPSEWEENNPLTIIESYSLGKPVIGSNIGGIPEILDSNKTGYLFKPGDKNSLKEMILRATSISDDEYIELSINARKFAETNFSPNKHYRDLINIYTNAIQSYENI